MRVTAADMCRGFTFRLAKLAPIIPVRPLIIIMVLGMPRPKSLKSHGRDIDTSDPMNAEMMPNQD